MRKLSFILLFFLAVGASFGQGINFNAHSTVPSGTDSDHGLSSLVMTDADCNITAPAGACTVPASDGPFRGTFLVTSSVPLTATRNIIIPNSPGRAIYIKNTATGTQQLCVKGTTGSSACIASGQTGVVLADGTNVNLISGGGGGTISNLGLVIADGVTYATIQAAYTAACAASPNLNVYVPSTSTVTDFAYTSQNYLVSTCTAQITDDRTGITFGARGNNLFQAQTPRKDYYTREALMKFGQIAMLKNGTGTATTGLPSVVQWVVANPGDSISDFATKYNLLTKSIGMGLSGMFQTASHLGTQNNEFFYGLPQTAFLLTSGCTGTCTLSPNGTADPSTVNGSSLTLGSSSTTGTLTLSMTGLSSGGETRFRNMQNAGLWYLCDGRSATLTVQTSADGGFTWANETVTTQPSSCAATGGIVAVGAMGVGSGTGCTSTLTLGATGGTGFSATAFTSPDPVHAGQIDRVVVNSQGSGYNPYTSTITITGGSCSVNPSWGNILTSNEQLVYLPITHDGISQIRASNSGDGIKFVGWGMYNPGDTGLVWIDEGFGGSSIDALFAPPSSYIASWYNNLPIADTVYTQYLDNPIEAGQPLGYWFGQLNTLYTNLHIAKAASLTLQANCLAADYGWDSACRAYTPDVSWISTYLTGNTTTVAGPDRQGDMSVMQQVDIINKAGGNALYVDNSFNGINSHDWLTRQMFSPTDTTTHMIPGGRMFQNKNMQQENLIPPDDILGNPSFNTVHVGQGTDTAPGLQFIRTQGVGLNYDPGYKQIKAIGGIVAENSLQMASGTYTTSTYIPVTGSITATYKICAAGAANLQPVACSTPVTVTNGPTTLSSTNYIQLCLNRPMAGSQFYTLIRTAGYAGPVIVNDTSLYSGAHTPACLQDTGQTGSAYTATDFDPVPFFRIGGPNTPVDRRQFGAIRTSSGLYDINLGEGLFLGGYGGFGLKVLSSSNGANSCRMSIGTNNWAMGVECGGTWANFPLQFRQPLNIQTGVTNRPNLDVGPTALLTGTTPTIRFAPTNAAGLCPSGGCNTLFDTDPTYSGYTAIFQGRGSAKFAVHAVNGLQFFGSSSYITSVNGTGPNLLRSTGTLTNTHMAVFDANSNATASSNLLDDGSLFSVVENMSVSATSLVHINAGGTNQLEVGNTQSSMFGDWAVLTQNAATSGANFNSSPFRYRSSTWTGSIAQNDDWTIQNVPGTGANPTSTLTITHTAGSSSAAGVSVPNDDFSAASMTTASFRPIAAQSTLSCSTAGTATFSEPFQGSSFKAVIYRVNGCQGSVTYTFPVPFTNAPTELSFAGGTNTPTTTTFTYSAISAMTGGGYMVGW